MELLALLELVVVEVLVVATVLRFVVDIPAAVLIVAWLSVVELLLDPSWSYLINCISSLFADIVSFSSMYLSLLLLYSWSLFNPSINCLISFCDTVNTMASSIFISVYH